MYIYIGTYYHTRQKGILSIVNDDGEYFLLEKKIGKTVDINQRETSLNRTKSPIGYTMLRVWNTGENTDKIEKGLHAVFDDVRSEGEWFEDPQNTLIDRVSAYMEIHGYPDVSLSEDEEIISEAITTRQTKNKWSNWNSIIGKTFYARKIEITCLSEDQWRCENTGEVTDSANKAFGLGAKVVGIRPRQNVWSMREKISGMKLREIHNETN
jgi:hypothetical protein